MILHGINSDDYLYFKLWGISDAYPFSYRLLENGTVMRFSIEELKTWMWKRSILQQKDNFYFEEEECKNPNAFLPQDLYRKAIVLKDIDLKIHVDADDILLIDEWLWERLTDNRRPPMTPENELAFLFGTDDTLCPLERNYNHLKHTPLYRLDGEEVVGSSIFEAAIALKPLSDASIPKLPIFDGLELQKSKIIDGYRFGSPGVIIVRFKKGDVIDFSSPVMKLLLLNQDYLRMFLYAEELGEEEKLKHFQKDFEGYVANFGIRYFKLHDYIKIKSLYDFLRNPSIFEEIRKRESTFQNVFASDHWRVQENDFDSEGYIRYLLCQDEPIAEHELAKIGTPLSYEEAKQHYIEGKELKRKRGEEKKLQRQAQEYYKNHQARYHKLKRQQETLSYIDFMLQEQEREKEAKKPAVKRLLFTLNQRIDDLNHQ